MSLRLLESASAACVSWLLRPLPRRLALGVGGLVGGFLAFVDRRHVGIAKDNLRHAFPDWTEDRLASTAAEVYRHFGRVVFDILWMQWRGSKRILPFIQFVGTGNFEGPTAAGKGILYCTAHIGNWEIHAIAHGWVYAPVSVVARPLDNAALDARLCAFRASSGNTVIYKRKALAQIIRTLREGGNVAMLLDQNVQAKDGIFIEFFGRQAATTTAAAALAVKTGCALVPCHTELTRDGFYRLVYDEPITWEPSGNREADTRAITQEIARRTEEWIRQRPEQWLWMHRRWKTRPLNETETPVGGVEK